MRFIILMKMCYSAMKSFIKLLKPIVMLAIFVVILVMIVVDKAKKTKPAHIGVAKPARIGVKDKHKMEL